MKLWSRQNMSHLNFSPQSGRPCYISLHRHRGRPSTTGFESITILLSAILSRNPHLQKLHCELRGCPTSTLMFRSSSSLPAGMSRESRERAGVPTGTQFVPDSRWPTNMEVVGNRSKGRRRRKSLFPFSKQVELAAYHDSQFVTCVARFLIHIIRNCKIDSIKTMQSNGKFVGCLA